MPSVVLKCHLIIISFDLQKPDVCIIISILNMWKTNLRDTRCILDHRVSTSYSGERDLPLGSRFRSWSSHPIPIPHWEVQTWDSSSVPCGPNSVLLTPVPYSWLFSVTEQHRRRSFPWDHAHIFSLEGETKSTVAFASYGHAECLWESEWSLSKRWYFLRSEENLLVLTSFHSSFLTLEGGERLQLCILAFSICLLLINYLPLFSH